MGTVILNAKGLRKQANIGHVFTGINVIENPMEAGEWQYNVEACRAGRADLVYHAKSRHDAEQMCELLAHVLESARIILDQFVPESGGTSNFRLKR